MSGEFWLGVLCGVLGVIGLAGVAYVIWFVWALQDWSRFGPPY